MDMEKLMRDYYTQFGWDPETGRPTGEIMTKLGIHGGDHGA